MKIALTTACQFNFDAMDIGFGHTSRIVNLAKALSQRSRSVQLSVLAAETREYQFIKNEGISAIKMPAYNLGIKLHEPRSNQCKHYRAILNFLHKQTPNLIVSDCNWLANIAAKSLKIPLVLITNIFNSPALLFLEIEWISMLLADLIVVPATEDYVRNRDRNAYEIIKRKMVITGPFLDTNYIQLKDREAIKLKLGLQPDVKLIFVPTAGRTFDLSLLMCALQAFKLMRKCGKKVKMIATTAGFQIVDYPKGVKIFSHLPAFRVLEYMRAADLIIAKSGHCLTSEIAFVGTPAILIPSSHKLNNRIYIEQEQLDNAEWLAKHGSAKVLLPTPLSPKVLFKELVEILFDEDKLNIMRKRGMRIIRDNGANKAADIILRKFFDAHNLK